MAARAGLLLVLAACLAAPAPLAAEIALRLPANAESTAVRVDPLASYALPVSAWRSGELRLLALEGRLSQAAWRLRDSPESSLQILQGLRAQILAAGYQVLFECETDGCGGFDFRFAMKLLPEPEMHVDLGDFRYLAAVQGDGPEAEHLALVVSRSTASGFVHLTQVYPATGAADAPGGTGPMTAPVEVGPLALLEGVEAPTAEVAALAARLETSGSAALDELAFETGSAVLSPGGYPSLAALAAYLAASPSRRVALVGHTDAVGGLDANIALSRKRAEAVRARLIEAHGVNPAQISAEGAGWLAPRASNLTAAGRALNRRVEVVLTST
ncbi:OmpA family protein [Phaeovulum sp.]|uniref:OmpA family protein n=1 Tax=Phaeovulum sp. TaxID=2934796 RepID=UPI00272F641D|nr:OmpA family protein [Phaeovulum sp.]MDP1669305.1 OmpA family protein [Phaeovulum sp.]MDZ4119581.1 OmpA family protein [Phaeovulum sp.]